MKLLRLFPLELGRLLHSRMTWLIVLLTVISPAVGLVLYKPAIASTMLSMYLANPALAGGAAGGILFGLLTVYELDRAGRSRVEVLTNAVVSPLAAALVRLPALLAAAGLALVLTMLVWLPISCGLIGSVFDGGDYVLAYLLFMGLALPLSILAASAAYQYTRRADLSLVLFAAFAALSLTVWADNWQLCWLNPCVWALSDDFSNFRIFRSVAWMRLTWLAALAGIWTVSYLCIRQYGKGLPGSLARSVRRAHRPIGSVFDGGDYVLAYLLFMGLALPLAILAASAAYQYTRRADLSLVLFAAFAALSLTVWADNWQLCWLNPCVWALSDDFSNFRIFRSVAWMRLTWLAALAGIWTVSYLCIRQYGKGLPGSLARSVRRAHRPIIALSLLACSGFAYAAQPLVDRSNPDQTVMDFYQVPYAENVVCTSRSAQVFPDTTAGTVSGTAAYRFRNTSGQVWTAAFGVNPGYTISNVRVNGAEVPFSVSDYQEYNEAMLEVALPSDREIELTMDYGGFPRENRNVSIMQGGTEISSEYLCLENAGLSPRLINVLPGENGYPTTIEITLPASMSVIPFGASKAEVIAEQTDGTKTWRYDSNSAGGILYAGDYIRQDIQAGGMDIEFYYGRKHQAVMEAAGAAEAVKSVVDYCTAHYGMLSFGSGDTLKLIQSRVTGGGYAANGASLLDEADFTADNLSDTGKGGGAGEVMIHELVHQWWGLGNMFDASDESSPWSAEGLTVYTTYRIVKERYGPSYAQEHYVDQWQQAVDNYYLNFYVRNPDYLEALPEEERLEISNSLRYVRQYCEMPLKILKAEQLVGGEEAMDRILRGLFNRELDPMYPYLTYQDFLNACGLTEEDLNLA